MLNLLFFCLPPIIFTVAFVLIKRAYVSNLVIIHRPDGKIDVTDKETGMAYLGISDDTYQELFVKKNVKSIGYDGKLK